MQHRWLAFLVIGFFAVVVFLLSAAFVKPIDLTNPQQAGQNAAGKLTEPIVTFVNPARGAEEPTVTLVEFSDFACEHCRSVQAAIDAALRAYPNDVRHVWKNLPNPSLHKEAIPSAVAAHCAGRQGRFWDFHDALFIRQDFLSAQTYRQIADELELDALRFAGCLEEQDTYPLVEKDLEEARALGLIATPTLFVGSQKVVGLVTPEELLGLIQDELSARGL